MSVYEIVYDPLEKKDVPITKHKLYSTMRNIISRCNNRNIKTYETYGARGIIDRLGANAKRKIQSLQKIPDWFEVAEIDRIDPFGYYTINHPVFGEEVYTYYDENLGKKFKCLGNLRWVTREENSKNKEGQLKMSFLKYYAQPMEVITKILNNNAYLDDYNVTRAEQTDAMGRPKYYLTKKK